MSRPATVLYSSSEAVRKITAGAGSAAFAAAHTANPLPCARATSTSARSNRDRGQEPFGRVLAVGVLGLVPLAAQEVGQAGHDGRVVFHDEYAHALGSFSCGRLRTR